VAVVADETGALDVTGLDVDWLFQPSCMYGSKRSSPITWPGRAPTA